MNAILLECLCWMAAILDVFDNRTFAKVGLMGIFNCGTNGIQTNSIFKRRETFYWKFVQHPLLFRHSFTRL